MASSWFGKTFGFEEFDIGTKNVTSNSDRIRGNFEWDADTKKLVAKLASGRSFHVGEFTTPSLGELKEKFSELSKSSTIETNVGAGKQGLTFENISGDVGTLIMDKSNEGAIFQAASQFNCLEMINPYITPEDGITDYMKDNTQGPTVAMKAPAGTLFRNYFVTSKNHSGLAKGTEGQTACRQIDTSKDLHEILKGVYGDDIWEQKNGYMIPSSSKSIYETGLLLLKEDRDFLESCKDSLRTGVHWDTETNAGHYVAQVYCSACPVAYDKVSDVITCRDITTDRVPNKRELWAPLASLILESTYESTVLVAAIQAYRQNKRKTLYLTKVGGGVFGNADSWIAESIQKVIRKYSGVPVDVKLVHYGSGTVKSNRYSSVSL